MIEMGKCRIIREEHGGVYGVRVCETPIGYVVEQFDKAGLVKSSIFVEGDEIKKMREALK